MGFPRNDFITEARRLGRSEEYIAETLSYASALDDQGLPVIFDQQHLAILLLMERRQLKKLINEVSGHYKYFAIKKRSGGLRRIMSPYNDLKSVQLWIKESILDRIEQPNYALLLQKAEIS